MLKRILTLGLVSALGGIVSPAYPAVCQLQVQKDNCFQNYNVSVEAYLQGSSARLFDLAVAKGQSQGVREFHCEPNQVLELTARFSPVFWQGDENKVYAKRSAIRLPATFPADMRVWKLTACFGGDFIGVPLPPEANRQCRCEP